MLALGAAAGCRRGDRAYSRRNTLIVAVPDGTPLIAEGFAGERLLFLPLVRINRMNGERQPCLATRWDHSPDYREWTYQLRPNVRWHDGRPLTMQDVTFTLELYGRLFFGAPWSVTVHDESAFTVRDRAPRWAEPDGEMDSELSILPQHALQDLDLNKFYDWDFWLRPIGCGPYRYVRDEPQTMVELEANPDYYKGTPGIARVVLKFAGEAGLTELLSGNVDAVLEANLAQVRSIGNDSRFRTFTSPWILRSKVIYWQNEHPLFRDRDIRRALSLAINRRELLQLVKIPSQFPLADGVYTARQYQRDALPEPRYDPAEASRLLDEAGWRARGPGGLRERGGVEFRFTALTRTGPGWDEMALYVQDQLHDLGVRMELQSVERGALSNRLKSRTFEAIVSDFGYSTGNLADYFGEAGRSGYRNPQLTRLIEQAKATTDPQGVEQVYREISDILRADQPVTYLLPVTATNIVHRRVSGLSRVRANPLEFTEEVSLDDRDAMP